MVRGAVAAIGYGVLMMALAISHTGYTGFIKGIKEAGPTALSRLWIVRLC